ncbi:MAG TPA: hypothetical protein VFK56_14950 [Mycobacterium sp.]|nr:hypothetical protein [Mycobacterium sp.]
MLKKLFITAAAAAAVSVPLAGAAWAAPDDPDGKGLGQGGVPKSAGAFADAVTAANPGLPPLNANGPGPLPPGQFYKNLAKLPGSTPEVTAGAVNGIYGTYSDIPDVPGTPLNPTSTFTRIPPGMATKTFTPACTSGHTAIDPNVNGGKPVCH